jgi:biotin operon repressor
MKRNSYRRKNPKVMDVEPPAEYVTLADRRAISAAKTAKLLAAIRRGRIASTADAQELLGCTSAWVWVLVKRLRDGGTRIATRTGDKWAVLP